MLAQADSGGHRSPHREIQRLRIPDRNESSCLAQGSQGCRGAYYFFRPRGRHLENVQEDHRGGALDGLVTPDSKRPEQIP